MTCAIVDGIVKTMKSKAGPSSKVLLTVADAEKFLANNEHSIVGLWTFHFLLLTSAVIDSSTYK